MVTFFSEKIQKIENLLVQSKTKSCVNITPTLGINGTPSLQAFPPVTEEDISKLIRSSASKSCIVHPIQTYILKECIDVLLPAITRIINLLLQFCTVPDSFKTAAVTPLLKKATLNPNCLTYFRPVSNLQFSSKILEVELKKLTITSMRSCSQHLENTTQRKQHCYEYRMIYYSPWTKTVFFPCVIRYRCCF